MKKNTWIIITVSILIFINAIIGIDAYQWSSKRLHIRYETITSSQIPSSLHDVSIALISDLEYGTFLKEEQLHKIQKKLTNLQPDIVLFSGDLIDQAYTPTEQDIQILINFLASLDGTSGKFAVYGEMDQPHQETVAQILSKANFEIIENKVMQIRNQNQEYIYLVGLPNIISTPEQDMNLFADIAEDAFVITLCHTPDIISSLPLGQVDLVLSGHSHASQYRLPFYGPLQSIHGNNAYDNGFQYINTIPLYVSGGIGTTQKKIRLFSDPEIPIFRLKSR